MNALDVAALAAGAWLIYVLTICIRNVYFHPLASFPGPKLAASSRLWKAYIDCVSSTSFVATLEELHSRHGDVVRVGPNELHFSMPETYHEIYNANNRWDKEESLYHSFGEDRSSFGYLAYKDAKDRKDILSRNFSRRAIRDAEDLVRENVSQSDAVRIVLVLIFGLRLLRSARRLSVRRASPLISSMPSGACPWM